MDKKNYNFQLFRFCLIFLPVILLCGCMAGEKGNPEFAGPPIESGKIAFLGFKPAISEGQDPDIFHNPISGSSVGAEPVSQTVTDKMSDRMYDMLIDGKDYEMINLQETKNLTNPALFKAGVDEIKKIQAIGNAVSADIVLMGYFYRFQEREGSELSASNPASVAFDVYLINVEDGAILWKGRFDKTQKFLSDNLLEIKAFFKFKGKWVDADTLAGIGLQELIDKMPLRNKK